MRFGFNEKRSIKCLLYYFVGVGVLFPIGVHNLPAILSFLGVRFIKSLLFQSLLGGPESLKISVNL